ncbi:MAG: transcription termination/antitermination protein NusA, partial [Clostridia bacterium]|nr:transcription termination/antitermination protein NusA [Clostridia bacterium]
MNKELFEALNVLEKEKGISKDYMIEKIEAALLSAFRKENAGNENARVKLDPVKQDVKLYKQLTVVEEVIDEATEISLDDAHLKSKRYKLGDVFEIELKTKNFGRIAAQAAKQVIIQGIREAE